MPAWTLPIGLARRVNPPSQNFWISYLGSSEAIVFSWVPDCGTPVAAGAAACAAGRVPRTTTIRFSLPERNKRSFTFEPGVFSRIAAEKAAVLSASTHSGREERPQG